MERGGEMTEKELSFLPVNKIWKTRSNSESEEVERSSFETLVYSNNNMNSMVECVDRKEEEDICSKMIKLRIKPGEVEQKIENF